MFLRYILIFLVVFSNASFAQPTENRVALVLGNSAYKSAPLRNPTNDARDMAVKLKGMGFTVVERNNLTVKQIGSTLREFRSKLTPGSVALVFYAGHGLQIKGENYFPTVDAEIAGEEDVPNQSLSMRQIMDVLGDAKTRLNLVFLDACRNNPYARSFRSSSDGLSKVNAPSGTLISFATRPGSLAADGTGRNGLYTSELLKAMEQKNQLIEQVLKQVVRGVTTGSKGTQEPWMEGSITGDFCFGGCNLLGAGNDPVQSVTNNTSDLDAGLRVWEQTKALDSQAVYVAYLEKYPDSEFAWIARTRMEELDKSKNTGDAEQSFWENAFAQNSRNSFQDYLARYPYGRYIYPARLKLAEIAFRGQTKEQIVIVIRNIEYSTKGFYDVIDWKIDGDTLVYEARMFSNHIQRVLDKVQSQYPNSVIKGTVIKMSN